MSKRKATRGPKKKPATPDLPSYIECAMVSNAIRSAIEIINNPNASESRRREAGEIIGDLHKRLFPKQRGPKPKHPPEDLLALEAMVEEADRVALEAFRWIEKKESFEEARALAIQFIMDGLFDAETTQQGKQYKPTMGYQPDDFQRMLENLPWHRPGRKTFKWEILAYLTDISPKKLQSKLPKLRSK